MTVDNQIKLCSVLSYICIHKSSLYWWNRITMMPVIQLANKPHVLVVWMHIHSFTTTWEINSVFLVSPS